MAAKNLRGAEGRSDVFMYDPAVLKVVTDKSSPLYDPRSEFPVDEALARNIARFGVKEPLLGYADGNDVYVKDGHQRRNSAILANSMLRDKGEEIRLVPVIIMRRDVDRLVETGIVTNEFRHDDDPIMRAERIAAQLDKGRDEEYVCDLFGIKLPVLKRYVALLSLSEKLKDKVRKGLLPIKAAAELAKIKLDDQDAKYDELEEAGELSGEGAQAAASGAAKGEKPKGKKKKGARAMSKTKIAEWAHYLDDGVLKVWQLDDEDKAALRTARVILDRILGDKEALTGRFKFLDSKNKPEAEGSK